MNRKGKIYEGKWLVVKITYDNYKHSTYILENIYNKKEITISYKSLQKIESGDLTIGKLIWYRIRRGNYDNKNCIKK